jgi:trk system potassium uptake protein
VKIVIAGGGSVGTSIALDLMDRHHDVTLMEQEALTAERLKTMLPGVTVMAADACEYASLAAADVRGADVMIAATGDDEDNLVISWLSKQEFGVPRVISRINNARNEWLFNESWGVDVSVSTPALITSLVDEAVEVGAIIQLMTLAHGRMRLIEVTLDANAPAVVQNLTLDELRLPDSLRVVAVVRHEQPLVPSPTMHFLEQDHVVLMARVDATQDCTAAFIG